MWKNVEKMRLLPKELGNIEMIGHFCLISNECMDTTKQEKTYMVRSTTDKNLFIIASDSISFHNPTSNPGLSMWF